MQPLVALNRRKPYFTYALAAINVLCFLLDSLTKWLSGAPLLTLWGAKINLYLVLGQWWRLVTPMFLHGGLEHLLFNTFALVIWGRQLEALLGRSRYLIVYFGSGILGCAASFAFSNAVSVGASGAIFGLFGALLFFRKQYKELFHAVFGIQVLIIIGINLVNGFLSSNIDNFGHIGGLIGGFLLCGVTGFFSQKRPPLRWIYLLAYALLLVGLVVGRCLTYFL